MKKISVLSIIFLFLVSCKEKKTELIESKSIEGLILLKNPKISQDSGFLFYKYTHNTKYFINHIEDSGGFSSEELNDYPEDEIAAFIISKCKNDPTKLVGRLHFYGLKGSDDGIKKIDSLIYKCK